MHHDQERLHALDAVRAFALLLGVVLHGTMSFMPGLISHGWPIADRSQSDFLQNVFFVVHIFRMTTFFVIAGFFAHLLFHRRGTSGFIKDRARRVLLPLVVGWLLLMPMIMGVFVWSMNDGSPPVVTAIPPPGATTLAFPLAHLWFLYVLSLLYVCVLCARHAFVKADRGHWRGRIDASVRAIVRWPIAPLLLSMPVIICLYNFDAWIPFAGIPTPDMSLVPNLPAFVGYLVAFSFGWLLHRQTSLLAVMQRTWPIYAIAAVALTGIALTMLRQFSSFDAGDLHGLTRLGYATVYGLASWCWTFGIIGGAMRFLSSPRPAVRYLADASYWVYLLHLPLVFAVQQVMSDWPLHWSVKFPVLLVVVSSVLLASYHYLVRSTLLGEVLNGRRYSRAKITEGPTPAACTQQEISASLATLRHARKRYGDTIALDGLDLEVVRSELVAVLGPNGAGKSTAIGLLLGLQRPDDGIALLFGESPQSLPARRQMGVMMQEVALAPELKVRELIDLTASYYPTPLTPEATMQITHTTELAQRLYGTLSGGQKRQVQFAMAIVGRPQLLFLDEPTVGLDVQAREMMWSTIRQLVRGGCSIVLTTHYIEEAEALANRVVVIAKGKVIASGSVNEMRSLVSRRHIQCSTVVPIEHIQAWPEVTSATHIDGRIRITTTEAEVVVRRLLGEDSSLANLEVHRAGLTEAFTELTQEAA